MMDKILDALNLAYNTNQKVKIGNVLLEDTEVLILIKHLETPKSNEMKVIHSFDLENLNLIAKELMELKNESDTPKKSTRRS